ncbi:N-terminal fungal transcription regulatory domain-containing protein [Purpureocillium lilacinum]|nr:N-terminal fungal transcription regulatory domain-containing protein [Purpureocillium lilacinum]OAQ92556.1 N-terminal fungal transcription regulatory domain-containing protein [Purpureocillium lilacinum]
MTRRKCAGYNYDLIFVPMSKTGSRVRHGDVSKKSPNNKGDARAEARRRAALKAEAHQQSPARQDHHASALYPISPSLHWPLQHIILLLIQNFAPTLHPDVIDLDAAFSPPRICGSWVELLPDIADTPEHEVTIAAPVRTLAMSILARGYHGIAPMGDALTTHCTALRSVNRALVHANQESTNVLTAAVMCLMISELILPQSDASTSQTHVLGLQALLKLQGPAFYVSGQAHRLFIGLRPAMIVQAICTRNPTFLAEPTWKTVPFKLIKPAPLHQLMTIAADLPGLLREFDHSMVGNPHGKSVGPQPRKVLSSHLELLHVLENWHNNYYEQLEQPSYWHADRKDHGPCLWFLDITVANCLTHYWALWIICVTNIRLLRATYPDLGALAMLIGGDVPESTTVTKCLREIAISILESVNYLMQDDMKLYGATSLILPLQTAFQHLRSHHPTEKSLIEACDNSIDSIEGKGFHYIGHFLRATCTG